MFELMTSVQEEPCLKMQQVIFQTKNVESTKQQVICWVLVAQLFHLIDLNSVPIEPNLMALKTPYENEDSKVSERLCGIWYNVKRCTLF